VATLRLLSIGAPVLRLRETETTGRFAMRSGLLSFVSAMALVACSGAPGAEEGSAANPKFEAEIRRTAYGVPHIKADDMGGIGYGYGYASAQDNVCEIADRILTVSGERAKFLGPGENDANIASDLYHQRMIRRVRKHGPWRKGTRRASTVIFARTARRSPTRAARTQPGCGRSRRSNSGGTCMSARLSMASLGQRPAQLLRGLTEQALRPT
jgi:Penicillin amidase